MGEVTDEPLCRDRACGIDAGKAQLAATIRVPWGRDPGRRAGEIRAFAATKRGVPVLAGWCRCWQVPAVVMEAAGDYRKGPFYRGRPAVPGHRAAHPLPPRPDPGAGPG